MFDVVNLFLCLLLTNRRTSIQQTRLHNQSGQVATKRSHIRGSSDCMECLAYQHFGHSPLKHIVEVRSLGCKESVACFPYEAYSRE